MMFFVTMKKIYIPQSLKQRVLSWYDEYLFHPEQTRTEKTVRNTMTWSGLTQDVEHGLVVFHFSSILNDKERENTQEIWIAACSHSK
jgi:hypothetical protein